LPTDIKSRIEEIEVELDLLEETLKGNPFNSSANARYIYLCTILTELTKYVAKV
jgi:hypothetical protein